MNLGDDIKVKKEGSEYKIEYSAKTTKSSGSKKADHAAPAAKHKAPAAAHDGDEPEGYISKSVSTQTKTWGKKSTKTTTTVYKFADGSSQTFTKTETHG